MKPNLFRTADLVYYAKLKLIELYEILSNVRRQDYVGEVSQNRSYASPGLFITNTLGLEPIGWESRIPTKTALGEDGLFGDILIIIPAFWV